MRRHLAVVLAVAIGLTMFAPAPEAARRKRVVRKPQRAVVVVHRGHPLRRRLPTVVVRAPRRAVAVAPAAFLAPMMWTPTIVRRPEPDLLVWEDGETLDRDEDWTDFTLNVDSHGSKLYLEIAGRAQLNFAEVVFDNGEVQVIDFRENARGPGVYSLLDFRDGRGVSHVRVVARARSDEARIGVRMAR